MTEEIFELCNVKFFDYFKVTFDSKMKTPELLRCGFETAFRKTLATDALNVRPFLIYFHDSNSNNHELYFKEIICNEIFCDYLINENWPIWPVDISDEDDKSRFSNLIKTRFNDTVFYGFNNMPMMIMFIREGLSILPGIQMVSRDLMTIVSQLFEHGESFKIDRDMRIEIIRSKRDMIKAEKEKENRKIAEENEARELLRLEELNKLHENEMAASRQKKIDFAKAHVKDVVPSGNNFIFRFRKPNGEMITREFSECQTLNDVIYFVESMELLRSEIDILFSYPLKNMCEMSDVNIELGKAGILKRELINIHMKK